jgi:hypothetical protein
MKTFAGSIVGALAAGAAAAKKNNATQATKDSYAGIVAYVRNKYADVHLNALERGCCSRDELIALEEDPTNRNRSHQGVID